MTLVDVGDLSGSNGGAIDSSGGESPSTGDSGAGGVKVEVRPG